MKSRIVGLLISMSLIGCGHEQTAEQKTGGFPTNSIQVSSAPKSLLGTTKCVGQFQPPQSASDISIGIVRVPFNLEQRIYEFSDGTVTVYCSLSDGHQMGSGFALYAQSDLMVLTAPCAIPLDVQNANDGGFFQLNTKTWSYQDGGDSAGGSLTCTSND